MKARTLPIALIIAFHITALTLFVLGAGIEYPERNRGTLLTYVFILELSLLIGFLVGTRLPTYRTAKTRTGQETRPFGSLVPLLGLAVMCALFFPEIRAYTGGSFAQFADFVRNPAEAYSLMADRVAEGRDERLPLLVAKTLSSFLVVTVLPVFGFLYFRYGRHGWKLLLASVLTLLTSIFRGTDKELFDVAILLGAAWVLARCHLLTDGNLDKRVQLLSRRVTLVSGVTAVGLVAAFSFRKSQRMEGVRYACFRNTDLCFYLDSSSPIETGAAYFLRYMTQGYYGLSVSFDAEQKTAGTGVGHSRPLQYLFEQFLGIPSSPAITGQLTDLGWTSSGAWSTGYVWIANDVTLYGVPVIMTMLGLVFGISWRQVLRRPDIPSLVVCTYSIYSMIYMIGTLQVAQNGSVYIGLLFWVLIFLNRRLAKSHGREHEYRDEGPMAPVR